ncbi:formyltetrahydrofolate deformylase [Denitromonas iodatirespirans]|uniref:Formyltetrahydrofolate deformylase n=1 Tax=Denitromonas iodatirespirans TaxID=2795389 RepID=A0A944DBQ6_DENI1|nr:formyltetrahydrofolate deformylase [Denitromonas iodatirespirans]MBT0961588.1 formyltetrahydrofolate deformylase [Denitromonas iodatirespirans]
MSVMTEGKNIYVLKASCKGAIGTVARISSFLAERHCYIMEMAQFDDILTGQFFVRTVFSTTPGKTPALEELKQAFDKALPSAEQDFEWEVHDTLVRPKVLLMVSKFDHCLDDLLYRHRTGDLKMDVTAIVSNHPDLKSLADWHGIPYHHLPVTAETKAAQEERLMELVAETGTDLIVLARYMQVLSQDLCRKLSGRAINIHHSFLPGFKGAKPYHQAHERGVKLIGATAHYVTSDLDEGPIIEQAVERVDHTYRPENLVAVGRDTECLALARAVRYHIEHRVFLTGNKTVVFR